MVMHVVVCTCMCHTDASRSLIFIYIMHTYTHTHTQKHISKKNRYKRFLHASNAKNINITNLYIFLSTCNAKHPPLPSQWGTITLIMRGDAVRQMIGLAPIGEDEVIWLCVCV